MFERLDRIHYDFVKNLMIFTKIHVFACLNWGEKQLSQLAKFENWTILKFQSLQFSVFVQQFGVLEILLWQNSDFQNWFLANFKGLKCVNLSFRSLMKDWKLIFCVKIWVSKRLKFSFWKGLFRLGSLYVKQRRTHCKHIVEKTKDLFSSKKSFL